MVTNLNGTSKIVKLIDSISNCRQILLDVLFLIIARNLNPKSKTTSRRFQKYWPTFLSTCSIHSPRRLGLHGHARGIRTHADAVISKPTRRRTRGEARARGPRTHARPHGCTRVGARGAFTAAWPDCDDAGEQLWCAEAPSRGDSARQRYAET
eukprot:2730490-Pleurochrysis_carterae.AAC.1